MKTCPGCSRSVADVIGQCPFCRHVFAGPVNDKPMLDPELISAAIAAEREEADSGRSALLQALLLLLALPVIVPSLIWFWIGAKRWGRIDWVLLAVSGGALTLFALGSSYALALMLIADAAAGALFVMRYGKLDDGIFLGYSNAVALPLILAGVLAAFGTFAFMPVAAISQLMRLYSLEDTVTVKQLVSGSAPAAPRPVRLEGATLAPTGRFAEVSDAKGAVRLVRAAALEPIAVTAPKHLWERREELVGSIVRLDAPAASETFVRTAVPMQKEVGGPKLADAGTRVYGLLPDAQDRVWVASEPVTGNADEVAKQLATRRERFGTLVVTHADPEMARAWSQRHGARPLPAMAVAVVPGAATGGAADPTAPTYAPVEDTGGQLWVYYPAGAPIGPTGSISGIFEVYSERVSRLAAAAGSPGRGPHRLVAAMTRDDFARAAGLHARVTGGTLPAGLAVLGLAALLALAGLIAALRE